LRDEEEGPVEIQVRIVIFAGMIEKRRRLEITRRIHQILDVAGVIPNVCDEALHILRFMQVRLERLHWIVRGQFASRLVEFV